MTPALKPYSAYKHSSVPWLGDVPAHWSVQRLRQSVDGCINGIWGAEPNGRDDLPCVRVADFDRHRLRVRLVAPTMRAIGLNERYRRLLQRGDLLLEKSGGGDQQPVGAVMLFDHNVPSVCSNFIARMPVSAGFVPGFLAYLHSCLYSMRLNVRSIKQTTGIQNLDSSAYLSEPVAFPPPDEQAAIVRFVDHADRRIRRYIAAKRKLIALLNEQKQAIIHQAVTRGLDPNVRLKPSGVEWLGDVPEHWDIRRLRDSVDGCTNGIWGNDPDGRDDLRCVRVADFDRRRLRVHNGNPTTRAITHSERRHRLLQAGDLLLEKSGGGDQQPVGVVILYDIDEPAVCSNFVAKMSVRDGFDPGFLSYLHSSLYSIRLNVRSIKQTTGIQNLDSSAYLDEVVAFPPSPEQSTIAGHLDHVSERIYRAMESARREIDLLREYRTRLIADVVTGKLDVREAAARLPEEIEDAEPLDETDALADGEDEPEAVDEEAAE